MSIPAGDFLQRLLAIFGCTFLILGVAWWTEIEKKKLTILGVFLGPWISGALSCTFLATFWSDRVSPALAAVSWPLISTAFVTIPAFIKAGPQFRIPDVAKRQQLIILILSNVTISCWIQFHVVIQQWIATYPMLLAEDIHISNFVTRLGPRSSPPVGGNDLLELIQDGVSDAIQDKPWALVERWLENPDRQLAIITRQIVKQSMVTPKDLQQFPWEFGRDIGLSSADTETNTEQYVLQLFAIWQGMDSLPGHYYLERRCEIFKKLKPLDPERIDLTPGEQEAESVGEITCRSEAAEFKFDRLGPGFMTIYLKRENIAVNEEQQL